MNLTFLPPLHVMEIHVTLMTTSKPFVSPFSYLKLHMPSLSLFQYAPVAECMPLRPTAPFPATFDMSSPAEPPVASDGEDISERCGRGGVVC